MRSADLCNFGFFLLPPTMILHGTGVLGYGFSASKTERIQSLGKPIAAAKNSSDNMRIILSPWPGFLLSHISFVERRKLAVIVLLLLVIVGIGLQHHELVEGVGKQSDVNG